MKSEWQIIRASDFIDFNPQLSLKKGMVATKISMDKLRPFTKTVPNTEQAEFFGGAKFSNGDTIMARITPCLENGKTAFVDCLEENEIAFGSTEFMVLRAKPGISNPQFVYYLATSPAFRTVAIKSMIGSSGRQRVQQNVLENLELVVPKLPEQEKIGRFLAMLDDKIALNEQVNDHLAEMVQSIYQQRFTCSDSSEEHGVLADICDYSKDRIAISALTVSNYYSTENMLPGKAGAIDASSLPAIPQTTKCRVGDVLISNIRPYFRKIIYCHSDCGCSTDVLCFTPKSPELSAFLFSTLYADRFFDYMVAGSKGTKMPRGDKRQIMTYSVHVPSDAELADFNALAKPMLAQIENNRRENIRLSALRDGLLPQLMSGEINVSDIQL